MSSIEGVNMLTLYSVPVTVEQSVANERLHCVVELRPLNSATWLHVQSLSHNPRVRYTCIHCCNCTAYVSVANFESL